LGRKVVEDIEFRIDPTTVERARADSQPRDRSLDEAREPIPDELLSVAGEITDPDLRERFIRAAENCIARREARAQS
jgi:hypothetical protein